MRRPSDTTPGERRIATTARRLSAIAVVSAVIATGLWVDTRTDDDGVSLPPLQDAGATTGASSSSWFCPATLASTAESTTGGVVVTNFDSRPVTVTATVFDTRAVASQSAPVDTTFDIEPATRVEFGPGAVIDSPLVSVLIDAQGGGLAVEQFVRDGNGESSTPCSPQAASRWYTADGSTDQTASTLVLFNPFPDEAIVDVVADTDAGSAELQDFRGIVVPGRSSLALDIGERLRRRAWVRLDIESRVGRVVAAQLQTGVLRGAPGTSVSLATPTTLRRATLPPGRSGTGVTDRITLANTTDREMEVRLSLFPEGDYDIVESSLLIAPGQRLARDLDLETSLPRDVSIVARVETDDDGLVVARTATAVAPSPFTGFDISQGGSTAERTRWVLPTADTTDPLVKRVAFLNTSADDIEVRSTIVGDGRSRGGPVIVVPAGRDAFLGLDDLGTTADQSVLFESTGPVAASVITTRVPGPTVVSRPLVALR